MANYRRNCLKGGTYFFTLAIAERRLDLLVRYIDALKEALRKEIQRAPFEMLGFVVLPDHLHAVWRLPANDGGIGRFDGFRYALPILQDLQAI